MNNKTLLVISSLVALAPTAFAQDDAANSQAHKPFAGAKAKPQSQPSAASTQLQISPQSHSQPPVQAQAQAQRSESQSQPQAQVQPQPQSQPQMQEQPQTQPQSASPSQLAAQTTITTTTTTRQAGRPAMSSSESSQQPLEQSKQQPEQQQAAQGEEGAQARQPASQSQPSAQPPSSSATSQPSATGSVAGSTSATTMAAAPTEPSGYVIVEEGVLVDLQQMPLTLMDQARTAFAQKNFVQASNDLSSAANLLRVEARKTSAKNQQEDQLKTAAANLDDLANRVAKNQVKSQAELNMALAQIAYQKANHHRLEAAEEWSAQHVKRAGHDLQGAADAIDRASKWSGRKIQVGAVKSVDGVRIVAGKLVQGTGWTTAEVGKAIDDVGAAVDRLGVDMQPGRQPASPGASSGTSSGTSSGATGEGSTHQ